MTSKLKTDVLETVSGSGTIALTNQLSGMTSASMPSGSVLQVQQFAYSGTTAFTASDVSILGGAITPKQAGSKFLIEVSMKASHTTNNSLYFKLGIDGNFDLASRGNGNPSITGSIYMETYGNDHSSNAQVDEFNGSYLYQHSGSGVINLLVNARLQGGTGYMNHAYSYNDSDRGMPQSTLTVTEIKQ